MKVKVFTPNSKGKIELTAAELEALLNEAYDEGYSDNKSTLITYPSYPCSPIAPYYITCSDMEIQLNKNSISSGM